MEALRHSFHWLTVLLLAVLTSTCLPGLALAPSARDFQMASGGTLAVVWFLWRLSFVGFLPTRGNPNAACRSC